MFCVKISYPGFDCREESH